MLKAEYESEGPTTGVWLADTTNAVELV